MGKFSEWLKYWGQLLLLPLYWLSFLAPRDRRIWLFGSTFGRRFADNPRYLYLYASQHRKELGIRPVWISRNKGIVDFLNENGYEAYRYHSLAGIWYALRGKLYLFDNYSKDINFWQSGGAVKVNLWHGIPLKKIQADNIFDRYRHPQNLWDRWKNFPRNLSDEKPHHYILSTSEFMKPIFSSAFRTKRVLVCGYPRNDSILSENLQLLYTDLERRLLLRIQEKTKEGSFKMLYYMPTFRDSEIKFFEVVALAEMNDFLQKNQLLLCVKLHPKSKLREKFKEIESENIILIDADTDPYVFIPYSSLLITDYSSIYFDYLLSGKPIVFFDYDLEEYLRDAREMYFDYETYTPGRKAASFEELQEAVLDTLSDENLYKQERDKLASQMFRDGRKDASGALVQELMKVLDGQKWTL